MVEAAKILNHQQRQALVDIFKTLDQAEQTIQNNNQLQTETLSLSHPCSSVFDSKDEYNQEYWSGHHYDSYNQDYPEDWVKRTQQRPRNILKNVNY